MSEEEKKAIEDLKGINITYFVNGHECANFYLDEADKVSKEIELILNLIEKQQKEIEHWKAGMKIVERDKNNHIERLEKELDNIKEIEKTHQEENGKLRVELEQYKRLAEMNLKDAEEFKNNMCEHRCILYNEKEELKADLYEANNIISDYIDITTKQYNIIEYVKDRIEYYLTGNSNLDDFYEREKELEKLLKILNNAEEVN